MRPQRLTLVAVVFGLTALAFFAIVTLDVLTTARLRPGIEFSVLFLPFVAAAACWVWWTWREAGVALLASIAGVATMFLLEFIIYTF